MVTLIQISNCLYVLYWHLILVALLKRNSPQLNMVLHLIAFLQIPIRKVLALLLKYMYFVTNIFKKIRFNDNQI